MDAPRAPPASRMHDIAGLAAFLIAVFAASALGSLATTPNIDPWYRALAKPAWTPPEAAFPIVWPILYAMMGVAAWRVWRMGSGRAEVRAALAAFAVQLAVNVAWSWAFFAARSPLAGLVVIAALIPAIAWTMRRFAPLDRLATWLLAPYLAWVCFAAALNAAILVMNA